MLGLVSDVPTVGQKAMKQRVDYLREFFDAAKDEEKLLDKFARSCLGRE